MRGTMLPPNLKRARAAVWVALMASLLVSTACGSSVDKKGGVDAQPERPADVAPSQPVPVESTSPPTGALTPDTAEGPHPEAPRTDASGGRRAAAVEGSSAPNPKPGVAAAKADQPRDSATPSAKRTEGTVPDAARPSVAPAPQGAEAKPQVKSTIILGSVGTQSGPIGEAAKPFHLAGRAWAASVNARGGLNGHPVKLIVADDDGDPNKALALVRRMVEQDKAIAIFGEHGPTSAQAILPYLEQNKIPSVGASLTAPANGTSPMAFPTSVGATYGLPWSQILPLMALSDKRKVSLFYCREAAACGNMRAKIREVRDIAGIDIVHEAQVSLAQPDFTAEVIGARNAGAEAIVTLMENASTVRIARSAHRQGWRPLIATQGSAHDERFIANGGEDVEGVLIGAFHPHWDSPKLAQYREAVDHLPGGIKASFGIDVWAAGKLLETIASGFPDVVTSADVLRGLYAIRGETLGGLVPPLTYREGEGHDNVNWCVVPMRVEKQKFVSPNGDNFYCAPNWKPVEK